MHQQYPNAYHKNSVPVWVIFNTPRTLITDWSSSRAHFRGFFFFTIGKKTIKVLTVVPETTVFFYYICLSILCFVN